jgi:hypothetical protein
MYVYNNSIGMLYLQHHITVLSFEAQWRTRTESPRTARTPEATERFNFGMHFICKGLYESFKDDVFITHSSVQL